MWQKILRLRMHWHWWTNSEAEAKLMDVALKTVADDQKLKELSDNIAKLALPDSARIIAQEVIKLAEAENK